jgi:hypothetical protein
MRSHTTSALIVVQLAMSFVLLAAAVLFARLPSSIVNTDPGFETRHTMTVPLEVEIPPYTEASALAFERSLESRILQVPGVQSLAWGSIAPFTAAPVSEVRLDTQSRGQGRPASIYDVSLAFFDLSHPNAWPVILRSDVSIATARRLPSYPRHSRKHSGR